MYGSAVQTPDYHDPFPENTYCITAAPPTDKFLDDWLVRTCGLIDVVSKNGCLMLNVGPQSDGTITDGETEVLLEIGKWLSVNGEGIYGSTYWKTYGEGPTLVP